MRTTRIVPAALAAAVLLTTGFGAAAQDRRETRVQVASSSSGGALYALGAAWSKLVNQKSTWVRATPVATGGGTENMRLLGSGEVEFGTVLGPESTEAYSQKGRYEGREPFTKLRAVWAYTYGGWQYVTLADKNIRSFADMKGKRISVGAPGSSGARYVTEILAAHGLDADRDYKRETLTGASGASALADGNLDVFAFGAPVPVSYISDLAASRQVLLVPVDKAKADAYVAANPGFYVDGFPKDGYPNQANQEAPLGVWWKQYWASRSDVDADVVYEMTKALFEGIDDFHAAHSSAKVLTLATAIDEVKIPLHAGAIRFYREKGIDVPAALVPPEAK